MQSVTNVPGIIVTYVSRRYREHSYEQLLMSPVRLAKRLQPGTFEFTVDYLMDSEIDLSVFESNHSNDEIGVPAYDPADAA